MHQLDFNDYLKWIRFRGMEIYKAISDVYIQPLKYDEDTVITQQDRSDIIEFINSIYDEVVKTNMGIDGKYLQEMNYLLFTHNMIMGSEYLFPDIYKLYNVENSMHNLGNVINSVSDSSTSVSSTTTKAAERLSFYDQLLMSTEFGVKYLMLLKQLQSIDVIL